MRNFVVIFVVLIAVYHAAAGSLNSAATSRQKRQLNESGFIAVKEGDVWAYVARRKYNGNLIVGKYVQEWNSIYLPYHGKELAFQDDIEVLRTNGNHMWIPYPGHVPENAIEGGKEGSPKLYIGRKWHDGKNLIGKIVEGINSIFCPYFNNEIKFDDNFDILVEQRSVL